MESHRHRCIQPLPPSTTSKPNVVLLGLNGLVLHIFVLAWNSCIKLVPHQLTVILGLVSTRAIFWEINIPKTGPDRLHLCYGGEKEERDDSAIWCNKLVDIQKQYKIISNGQEKDSVVDLAETIIDP